MGQDEAIWVDPVLKPRFCPVGKSQPVWTGLSAFDQQPSIEVPSEKFDALVGALAACRTSLILSTAVAFHLKVNGIEWCQ